MLGESKGNIYTTPANMNSVATKTFQAPISIDNGFTNTSITEEAEHSLELFLNEDRSEGMIEWVAEVDGYEEDEFVTHIGLWFNENGEIYDYDGVFELPSEITDWLIELGYNVDDVTV
jgi:hypothetical protein